MTALKLRRGFDRIIKKDDFNADLPHAPERVLLRYSLPARSALDPSGRVVASREGRKGDPAEGGDAANYWLPGDAPRRYPTAQATTRAVDASRILALHKFPWRCWPALGAMVGGLTVRVTPQRVDCHRPARLRGCSQRRLCAHTDPQYSCNFPGPPAGVGGGLTTLCCPHAFNATVDVSVCRD